MKEYTFEQLDWDYRKMVDEPSDFYWISLAMKYCYAFLWIKRELQDGNIEKAMDLCDYHQQAESLLSIRRKQKKLGEIDA